MPKVVYIRTPSSTWGHVCGYKFLRETFFQLYHQARPENLLYNLFLQVFFFPPIHLFMADTVLGDSSFTWRSCFHRDSPLLLWPKSYLHVAVKHWASWLPGTANVPAHLWLQWLLPLLLFSNFHFGPWGFALLFLQA